VSVRYCGAGDPPARLARKPETRTAPGIPRRHERVAGAMNQAYREFAEFFRAAAQDLRASVKGFPLSASQTRESPS